MVAAGVAVASCAQPTPETIVKEVPVEKVVKETVVVEKEVAVEKIVKETVMVEKEVPIEKVVVVEGEKPSAYHEAPMLAELVKAGKLPPVEERLPENPLVLEVVEGIGDYGGTWRRAYKGVSDRWGPTKINHEFFLEWHMPVGGSIHIQNHVAEKYEQNADATEFTWYLRKGQKWSNGDPLTTEDVKFWYEDLFLDPKIKDNQTNVNLKPGGKPMVIEILDEFTFKTKFAAPNPLLPLFLCVGNATYTGPRSGSFMAPANYLKPFHYKYAKPEDVKAALVKYGNLTSEEQLFVAQTGNLNFWFHNPDLPVLQAWRMKVSPIENQTRCMMERNPYYYAVDPAGNQLPYIDYVTHDFFDNTEVFAFKLINGEIDCQQRHVSVSDYTLLRENEQKGDYRLIIWRTANTLAYHFNLSWTGDPALAAILNDVRFRQAFSLAIDRDEINQVVYNGLMEPRQASPVSGSPNYDPELETYFAEYDPDRANALLDEMGLTKKDSEGYRLRPDGQPLVLTICSMQASFAGADDMHQIVVDQLKLVGIKVLLDLVERSLYQERLDANQLHMTAWVQDRSAIVMADVNWYVDGENPAWTYWRDGDARGVEPPADAVVRQTWALWDQCRAEADQAKREEIFKQMLAIQKEQLWNVGVVGEGPALFVTRNNFRNVPDGLVEDDPLRGEGLAHPPQFYFKAA